MENFKTDCLIIGGGVAGIACAKHLAQKYDDIYLIEKNNALGLETSSRNSEVTHAGIYYKKNSLKSKLCIRAKVKGENDFIIDVKNFTTKTAINILGYISPGLTSSFALGEYVKSLLNDH